MEAQTSHPGTGHAPAPLAPRPARRRAYRRTDDRVVGGVAAGLAQHLGVDTTVVRASFLAATLLGGFGLALYAGLWMILPSDVRLEEGAPGLDAATRQGKRPRRSRRLEDVGPAVALAALAIGLVVLAQSVVGSVWFFWPLLLGILGLGVLWWQADEAQRERWLDASSRIDPVRAVLGGGGVASWARLVSGIALLLAALGLFAFQTSGSGVTSEVLGAGVLGVLGLALVAGPWVFRLAGDLSEERAARVRSQERADVAAHLHDSVLQTLALIQKHAGDERSVARLARAQERDLRAWLYGDQAEAAATSVAAALRRSAAEVEDVHGVPVEVVTVGDVPASESTRPLVLAAREAMVNAAKHSGADKIDVYAEIGARDAEVFVRDRGSGFARAEVPLDRLGVRNSIEGRMERHGGSAEIRTGPGEGTEVRLRLAHGPADGGAAEPADQPDTAGRVSAGAEPHGEGEPA